MVEKSREIILILTDSNDSVSNTVMNYLHQQNETVIRVNSNDELEFSNLTINHLGKLDFSIVVRRDLKVHFSQIKSYWYRRGDFSFRYSLEKVETRLLLTLKDYLSYEVDTIKRTIHNCFHQIPHIGSIVNNTTNKLVNLALAKSVGFDIPETIITHSKNELEQFFLEHEEQIIAKAIGEGISKTDFNHGESIDGFTSLITKEMILDLEDEFFPTLFQQNIEKKWELRVFYLHGKCYANAIFSQGDEKTKVDFRHYNIVKENRTPPYNLPSEIEDKIDGFMKKVKMNSGSIDLIYTKSKKYVFLEINPIGQFEQVSIPCNFHLEKEVSKFLSNPY